MAGIIGKKLQDKIEYDKLNQYNDSTGIILDYDSLSNTATIRYPNPNGDGYLYRKHAYISSSLGGITSDAIQPGNKCSITFIHNNIYAPMITGITTSKYLDKTNTDQGAYLIDRTLLEVDKQDGPVLIDTWFDESNENTSKYSTDFNNYMETDSSKEVYNIIDKLDKYKDGESGMTNLNTKANIKQTENGDIEIFVSNTVGVRISCEDHKIYFYGKDIYLNDKPFRFGGSIDISNVDEDNTDYIISEFEKLLELMQIEVDELKRCIFYLKKIIGIPNKYSTLESKIKRYETIRDTYVKGVTPIEDIISYNSELLDIRPVFIKEIYDAKKVIDKNISLIS